MTVLARTATAALVVAVTGCTASSPARPSPSPSPTQRTRTIVATSTAPAPKFTPAPATSVRPLGPGQPPPAGERAGPCPYIRSGQDEDPTTKPNVADLEGSRVYRTTVLTTRKPVGCRFYFEYGDHEATTDILPSTFATAFEARDALVRTAEAGRTPDGHPNFVPHVDGIGYRTRFYGPDGARDWAFAFAKGRVLVVVHTNRSDDAHEAEQLARAIVGRF